MPENEMIQTREPADCEGLATVFSNPLALQRLADSWTVVAQGLEAPPNIETVLRVASLWLERREQGHTLLAQACCSTIALVEMYYEGSVEVGTFGGPVEFLACHQNALRSLARVYLFGRKKYGTEEWPDGNYKLGQGYRHYLDHALGHLLTSQLPGSNLDQESKEPHLTHAVWNMWQALDQPATRDDRVRVR